MTRYDDRTQNQIFLLFLRGFSVIQALYGKTPKNKQFLLTCRQLKSLSLLELNMKASPDVVKYRLCLFFHRNLTNNKWFQAIFLVSCLPINVEYIRRPITISGQDLLLVGEVKNSCCPIYSFTLILLQYCLEVGSILTSVC